MFQRCPDDHTICFHGASCVKGAGDGYYGYYCDCSTTVAPDVMYVGQHCEYEVTTFCDLTTNEKEEWQWWKWQDVKDNEEGQWICANDATCSMTDFGSRNKRCNCPKEYEGLHCEFLLGTAPKCRIQCVNGGICKIGIQHYQSIAPPLREYFEQYDVGDDDGDEGHCLCPEGFTGRQCEASILDCGGDGGVGDSSSHQCLNGGECGSSSNSNNDDDGDDYDGSGGGTEYKYCDCGTAIRSSTTEVEGGDGMEVQFAGNACESASSTFCPTPSGFDPLDFYCTNGGICGDNSWDKCVCSADYSGPRCEFLVQYHTDCDLQCENGGTCFFGDEPTTTPYNALDIDVQPPTTPTPTTPKLNPLSSVSRHCKCPDGFIGDICETSIEICGSFVHHCLNGGMCVGDDDEFTCDCFSSMDGLVPHAGEICQYIATEICEGGRHSFCTNNGKCKDVIDTEDSVKSHPGCVCSDGFKGDYCEISPDSLLKVIVEDVMWLYLALFGFAIIMIVVALLYFYLPHGVFMALVPVEEEEKDNDDDDDDDEGDIQRDDVLPTFKHYLT